MSLRLPKFEADDPWTPEPETETPQASIRPGPAPLRRGDTAGGGTGISDCTLRVLRRHGLLSEDDAPAATGTTDRRRAIETARELVDQAYAVPDGGWVEGGGLWTTDRHNKRRGG